MQSKRVSLVVLTVAGALTLAGVALMATSSRQQTTEAAAELSQPQTAAVRVSPLTVTRRFVRDQVEVPGVIKPIRRVVLSAEIDGRIAAIGAREHEPVEADQVIVQLDDTIRKAALGRAEAAVLRTRSSHRLAQLELDRLRNLFDQGVSSEAELDRATSEERATFGALGEAEAMLAEARELVKKTTIRAPFDGILNDFDLEVGDRLNTGGHIGEVIDLARVEIEVGVTDAEVIALRPRDGVEFVVGVYPGRRFRGTIRHIGSALDATTRKFPVEVVADNPDGLLLPGMVTRVTCEVGDEQPVIRIPREAALEEFGVSYVFVLEGDGARTVARRKRVVVRSVPFRPALLEVAEGLQGDERIAAAGLRDLRDGMAVAIEEQL